MSLDKKALVAKSLQLLDSSKEESVYFHGLTMKPFLIEGDEAIVRPVNAASIKVGDIVTYWDDDKFPTRRIVKLSKDRTILHIKGDNLIWKEFDIPYTDVLGKVIARKRGGKWISQKRYSWHLYRIRALVRYRLFTIWASRRNTFLIKNIGRLFFRSG